MTIVPRTGPLSASSALARTSWYQRGKSSACGVRIGALAMRPRMVLAPRERGARGSRRWTPAGVAAGRVVRLESVGAAQPAARPPGTARERGGDADDDGAEHDEQREPGR